MRHRLAGNKLGRDSTLRHATMRDMARAILINQRIYTTVGKAKEARKMVDHLITLGKRGTLACRRRAFSILCDHTLVSNLFNNIAKRFEKRNGGYTRVIRLGTLRRGDNAKLAFLELTEVEIIPKTPKPTKTSAEKPKARPSEALSAPAKPEAKQQPHAPKDLPDKMKPTKGFMGGIKQMFTKKPSDQ